MRQFQRFAALALPAATVLALAACSKPADAPGAASGDAAPISPGGPGPRGGFFAVDQTLDQMLERTRNRFERLDADGDGRITASDLEAARAAAESQGGPGGMAGRRGLGGMMRADADGDGVVTRAEAEAQTRQRFERLDADKDGKVTGEEMMAAFPRRGQAPSEAPDEGEAQ